MVYVGKDVDNEGCVLGYLNRFFFCEVRGVGEGIGCDWIFILLLFFFVF